MEERKNKIILISLVAILVFIAVIFIAIFMNKDKKQLSQQAVQQEQGTKEDDSALMEKEGVPLTIDEKETLDSIEDVTGKITSIDINQMKVLTNESELELKIPQKGASFVMKTVGEDGVFILEDIGLFQIPTNREVEIQYNSKTNEVMLVVVE